MTTRPEIIAAAREMIGVPWVHQGRSERGLDCGGLLVTAIAKRFALTDADVVGYDRMPDGKTLKAICDEHMMPIRIDEIQPADVVLMIGPMRRPQHLALVTDYPWGGLAILHAAADHGKVIEHRLNANLARRIVAAYRLPGVDGS